MPFMGRFGMELRSCRDDAGRVHHELAAVLGFLDVFHVDCFRNAWLLVEIAGIPP